MAPARPEPSAVSASDALDQFEQLAVPGVRRLQPYLPGKPITELQREYGLSDIIKLASNENPLGPSRRVVAAIREVLDDLWLYPDGSGFALKAALAERHDCPPECITLGNGSNDVLVLLAAAFLGAQQEAVYSEYSFAVYRIAVQATGAVGRVAPALAADHPMALGHDLQAMAALISERTRLVFIANPNNPTGTWVGAQPLREFIARVPEHALVVIDEAYFDYVQRPEYPDATRWLDEFPNLVVTRTFSKAFGLAGLRVGYAVSHPGVAAVLNRVRQPFNVSALAQVGAREALRDEAHLRRSREVNASGLARLGAMSARLGLRHPPSVGNFVLVDLGQPAAPVYEGLLRRGIIARPVKNYGLPNCLRITVGLPEQLDALETALTAVLQES